MDKAIDPIDVELEGNTLEELQYIYETQQDLYTPEELESIEALIASRRAAYDAEKTKIEGLAEEFLPDQIPCQKCGGNNSFGNANCRFCEVELDKSKYYIRARSKLLDELKRGSYVDKGLSEEAVERYIEEASDELPLEADPYSSDSRAGGGPIHSIT